MSTLKKILALTLALAMVMSLGVFAAFKDQATIDEDCADAMELMNALGVMLGDNNGNANPTNAITRAEAATMIFRLMNKGSNDASGYEGMKIFSDVSSGSWFEGYVNYCYTLGIIAGRTATTFDPYAPVTGVEIAKMLLGCLKYNSTYEGYTGATWANNVLSDAQAAGLLDDYGMSVSSPAQRQWVAQMFAKALEAEVVGTYFDNQIFQMSGKTLGDKQFGLTFATQYLIRTEKYGVETGNNGAGTGKCKTVATTDDEDDKSLGTLSFVANTDLLGQEVTVVYKSDSNGKISKVYGIYATGTSDVDQCAVTDSDYDSDDGFTIGNLTMDLDEDCAIFSNNSKTYTVDMLENKAGDDSAAIVKAVDKDGDGDFDYIFVIASDYGEIEIDDDVAFEGVVVDEDDIADKINYVNTVEDGDFVKVTPNLYTGKYDIEALTASELAFTAINGSKFKLGGTYYYASVDVDSSNYADLSSTNYDKNMTVYMDGGFIVYAEVYEETTTSMPSNIALVTAIGTKDDAYDSTTTYVKLLTLDGKITEYEYYKKDSTSGQTATDVVLNKNTIKNTIVQYVVNSDGTLYFKSSVTKPTDVKYAALSAGEVDISTGRYASVKFDSTAKFFVYDADEEEYSIMTFSQFKSDFDITDASEMYYYQPSGKIGTYVAGFLYVGDMGISSSDKALCISTSAPYSESIDGDTYTVIDVKYANGTTATLIVDDGDTHTTIEDNAGNVLATKTVYWYTTDSDGYSTLYAFAQGDDYVTADSAKALTVVDGNTIVINDKIYDVADDCVIVLKKVSGGYFSSTSTAFTTTLADVLKSNTTKYTFASTGYFTYDSDDGVITNLYVEMTSTAK